MNLFCLHGFLMLLWCLDVFRCAKMLSAVTPLTFLEEDTRQLHFITTLHQAESKCRYQTCEEKALTYEFIYILYIYIYIYTHTRHEE